MSFSFFLKATHWKIQNSQRKWLGLPPFIQCRVAPTWRSPAGVNHQVISPRTKKISQQLRIPRIFEKKNSGNIPTSHMALYPEIWYVYVAPSVGSLRSLQIRSPGRYRNPSTSLPWRLWCHWAWPSSSRLPSTRGKAGDGREVRKKHDTWLRNVMKMAT